MFTLVWSVMLRPVDGDERDGRSGEHKGGLAIYVTDGEREEQVALVAYNRRVSKDPYVSFVDKLDEQLGVAQAAADAINEAMADFEAVENDKVVAAQERLKELLAPARERAALK